MKALSNKISDMSLKSVAVSENFDVLKRERRQEIMNILKGHASLNPNGFTITDIKNLATGAVASCGSKTLQRELVSMVKNGILIKTGDKRWSKYSLVQNALNLT